jgi:membrane-bound metal-dependent hydrolase YbcI (DUF457 family)
MPSPVGHLVAGFAVAWAAEALAPPRHTGLVGGAPDRSEGPALTPLVAVCGVLALAPDVDILWATHRAYTHSLGAVVLVACVAAAIARARGRTVVPFALACAAAWGSHVLLDWLGHDSSPPVGLMALWPFTDTYTYSGLDLFGDVSRRYWRPREFILGNAAAVLRELLILAPPAALAFWLRRRATTR